MKGKSSYLILVSAILIAAAACSTEGTAPESGLGKEFVEIKVRPSYPELKSLVDPMTDSIFAYSVTPEQTYYAEPAIESGIYTYQIPADTYFIIFSNIGPANNYIAISSKPDTLLKFTPQYVGTGDFVVATTETIPETGSSLEIHLSRKIAKITADMTIKTATGELLDISEYIQYAKIELTPQSRSYLILDASNAGYDEAGSVYYSMTGTEITESTTSYRICEDKFAFPTNTAVSATSTLTLTMVNSAGIESSMSKDLGYAIEPNKHYRLSISVRQDETGFGFSIEDIVSEEITVDLN